MKENDIIDIIKLNSIPELLNKIGKFCLNGFDIVKIDEIKRNTKNNLYML